VSLTGRFSALFLGALGLVLVAFSTVLYLSARIYLDRQVGDRLDASLAVLAAAAEIHAGGIEWEPQERILPLGQEPGPERLRWLVLDGQGHRVDHSRNLVDADLTADWVSRPGGAELPSRLVDRTGRTWRVAQRRLRPGAVERSGSHAAAGREQPGHTDRSEGLYPSLILTVCAPLGPKDSMLATLGWLLVAMSTGSWLLAALICRRLSRRALAPLARMVGAAGELNPTDPGWSLEMAGTGDELDDLGRAFNDLLARLHLAYQRQRRFSSDASHQLRTPLTILIGQLEVALRHERSGEEYRRALKSALGKADQLRQIVEALLFLGRADSDAQLLEGEVIDLEKWVAQYLADRRVTATVADRIHFSASGEPLAVRIHPPLLTQLLDNLLDNAQKYSREGSPILVETLSDHHKGQAILAVQDTGAGIPPEDVSRVFEPFYRSEQERRRGLPGVGLGLAIVHRIATAFGGTASLKSSVGVGSRFEVRLPIAQTNTAEMVQAARPATILARQ
jgi:two-component system, OmpR family, sensor kinase